MSSHVASWILKTNSCWSYSVICFLFFCRTPSHFLLHQLTEAKNTLMTKCNCGRVALMNWGCFQSYSGFIDSWTLPAHNAPILYEKVLTLRLYFPWCFWKCKQEVWRGKVVPLKVRWASQQADSGAIFNFFCVMDSRTSEIMWSLDVVTESRELYDTNCGSRDSERFNCSNFRRCWSINAPGWKISMRYL